MIPTIVFLAAILQINGGIVPGGTVTFYLYDDDLNLNHRGIDEVETAGLFEFTINNVVISGPAKITETTNDSGVFVGQIFIPQAISGRPLQQGDTLVIKYRDQSDSSGNLRTLTKSVSVTKSNTNFDVVPKNIRIGQTFQIRIYDPDFNLDSRRADNIPLSLVEFRAPNGIRVLLTDAVFDPTTKSLRETADNSNTFVATLKMPKEIGGKRLKIGSTAEFRFTDTTSPSGTTEILKTKVRIGLK